MLLAGTLLLTGLPAADGVTTVSERSIRTCYAVMAVLSACANVVFFLLPNPSTKVVHRKNSTILNPYPGFGMSGTLCPRLNKLELTMQCLSSFDARIF
jgi:hypothetical protein